MSKIKKNLKKIISSIMAFAMCFSMAGLSSITAEAAVDSSVTSVATVMPSGTGTPTHSQLKLTQSTLKSWDFTGSDWEMEVLDGYYCFTLPKTEGTFNDDLTLHFENVGSLGDRTINADVTITKVKVSDIQSSDSVHSSNRWVAAYTSASYLHLSMAGTPGEDKTEAEKTERYPYRFSAAKDVYYTVDIQYADTGKTVDMSMIEEVSDIDQTGSYFEEGWSGYNDDYSKFYVWDECNLKASTTYDPGYTTFYVSVDGNDAGDESYYKGGLIAVAKSGKMRAHYMGGNCAIELQFAEPKVDPAEKTVTSTPPDGQKYYQVGDEVTFNINYEMPTFYLNEFALYTSMVITDELPAELTYKDASISATSGTPTGKITNSGQTVTWTADSSFIGNESNYAGQTVTLTITATVNSADINTNKITNTGIVAINGTTATDTADVTIVKPALSIEKSADRVPPEAYLYNDPDDPDACVVTYTIVVDQVVDGAVAYNAKVWDTLPDEVSLIDVVADGGTVTTDGNSFTVTYDSIAYNSPKTITVTAQTVALGEDIPNTAYAVANTGKSTDEQTDQVEDDAEIRIIGPKFDITKDADEYKYYVGDTVEYTIMVELNDDSEVEAKGIKITDELPEGTVLIGQPTVTCQTNARMATHAEITVAEDGRSFTIEWPVNSLYYLTMDDVIMVHVNVKVTDEVANQTITNIAKVTAVNTPEEPEADVPVEVIAGGLDITKVADKEVYTVGDIVTYTITVTQNQPDITVYNVEIGDELPSELALIDVIAADTEDGVSGTVARYGNNSFSVVYDHLNYGDAAVLTVTAKALEASDNVLNSATAVGDEVPEVTDTEIIEIIEPKYDPDLDIEKTVDYHDHFVNDDVVYTITVRQTVEGAVAEDVVISDNLPEGMTLEDVSVADEFGAIEIDGNSFTVSYDTLSYGEDAVITVIARAEEEARDSIVDNVAVATASNVPDPVQDDADIYIEEAELSIVKDVDSETHQVGDEVVYTITVSETKEGEKETNVIVSDSVPDGLTIKHVTLAYADGTLNQTGQDFTVEIPELEFGTDAVITVTAKVGEELAGQTVKNVAYAKGDHTEEISDDADVKIPDSEIKIVKDIDSETHEAGDEAVYTITVSEIKENETETNVVVTDSVPEGLTIEDIALDGVEGEIAQDGQQFTVDIPELTYGEDAVITVKVMVGEELAGQTVTNVAYAKGDNSDEVSDDAIMNVPEKEEPEPVEGPKGDDGNEGEPGKDGTTTTTSGEGPKTGDYTNMILWIVLGILAVGGCTTGVIVYRRRKRD